MLAAVQAPQVQAPPVPAAAPGSAQASPDSAGPSTSPNPNRPGSAGGGKGGTGLYGKTGQLNPLVYYAHHDLTLYGEDHLQGGVCEEPWFRPGSFDIKARPTVFKSPEKIEVYLPLEGGDDDWFIPENPLAWHRITGELQGQGRLGRQAPWVNKPQENRVVEFRATTLQAIFNQCQEPYVFRVDYPGPPGQTEGTFESDWSVIKIGEAAGLDYSQLNVAERNFSRYGLRLPPAGFGARLGTEVEGQHKPVPARHVLCLWALFLDKLGQWLYFHQWQDVKKLGLDPTAHERFLYAFAATVLLSDGYRGVAGPSHLILEHFQVPGWPCSIHPTTLAPLLRCKLSLHPTVKTDSDRSWDPVFRSLVWPPPWFNQEAIDSVLTPGPGPYRLGSVHNPNFLAHPGWRESFRETTSNRATLPGRGWPQLAQGKTRPPLVDLLLLAAPKAAMTGGIPRITTPGERPNLSLDVGLLIEWLGHSELASQDTYLPPTMIPASLQGGYWREWTANGWRPLTWQGTTAVLPAAPPRLRSFVGPHPQPPPLQDPPNQAAGGQEEEMPEAAQDPNNGAGQGQNLQA